MKSEFGQKAAVEILSKLSKPERDRILLYIEKCDPKIAEELKRQIVTLDDLQFISVKMLQELLGQIKLDDLALALRLADKKTLEFILGNVSSSLRQDIVEVFSGPPLAIAKVQEAYESVMRVVREKIDKGEIVLEKDGLEV